MVHTRSDVAPIFESLEPTYSIDESAWHKNAVTYLLPEQEIDTLPEEIARESLEFLTHFHYEKMGQIILRSASDPREFKKLRRIRKNLTTGRDALNLSNTPDLIDFEPSEPLRAFIMNLGEISDTDASVAEVIERAHTSLASAQEAARSIADTYIDPVSPELLKARMLGALATDILTSEATQQYSEESYHIARQSFRAVVNLGVMSQILHPSAQKLQFVREGLHLNKKYGRTRDSLKVSE